LKSRRDFAISSCISVIKSLRTNKPRLPLCLFFIPRPGAHALGSAFNGLGGKRNLAGKGRVARRILSGPSRTAVIGQRSTVYRLAFWPWVTREVLRGGVRAEAALYAASVVGRAELHPAAAGLADVATPRLTVKPPRRKRRDYFIKRTERARLISRVIFRCMCAGIPVTLRGRIFPLSVTNFLRRSGFL
jgi:hypothetical protein